MILLALMMCTFLSIGTANGIHYESKDLDHVVELTVKQTRARRTGYECRSKIAAESSIMPCYGDLFI